MSDQIFYEIGLEPKHWVTEEEAGRGAVKRAKELNRPWFVVKVVAMALPNPPPFEEKTKDLPVL